MKIQIAINPTFGDTVILWKNRYVFSDNVDELPDSGFNFWYTEGDKYRDYIVPIATDYCYSAYLLHKKMAENGEKVLLRDGFYNADIPYFPYYLWGKKKPRHCKIIEVEGVYPVCDFTAVDNWVMPTK